MSSAEVAVRIIASNYFSSLWDLQSLSRLLKVFSRVEGQGSKLCSGKEKGSKATSNRSPVALSRRNSTCYLERGDVSTVIRWEGARLRVILEVLCHDQDAWVSQQVRVLRASFY